MGKVKGKHRLDKYYRLAKEHGYRSRASWKLVQLDSKFSFLQSSRAVLDLCAAPGGWMQVAVQRVPVGSLVLGIDLVKIAPLRGALSIEQDITKPDCRTRVKKVMTDHNVKAFDLVLHDGSPNIGGAWSSEAVAQNSLVIDSLKLATQFLAPKGNFVTKVFRSQDYSSIIYCLNQLFEKVEVEKPAASRSASAEIFVLGLRYKAPAKIDPRLLDVKHLFQGSSEPTTPKVLDVLRPEKQKRHRDGYEDGESIVRKVASASDFIFSENPLEFLGQVTSITFEGASSLPIKDHELTTEEINSLCDDLRVLGKQDFKHLLKWRMQLRKALMPSKPTTKKEADENNDEDDDDKLLNEMEELTHAMERKKKREKKLIAKRKAKDKARKATGMQIDAMEDGYADNELFSLSSIKKKKDLATVESNDYSDIENLKDSDDEIEERNEHSSSDLDSDEQQKRYDEQLDEILDHAYETFVSKREGASKQRKRIREAYKDNLKQDDDDAADAAYRGDESDDDGHGEANPLMVPLAEEKPGAEEVANKWFSQEIFANLLEEKPETKIKAENKVKKQAAKKTEDFEVVPAEKTDSESDSESESESSSEDDESKAEILACAKKMLRKKRREEMLDDAYNRNMFDEEGLPGWFVEDERRHRQAMKPVTKEEVEAMKAQFREINARPAKKVAEAKARKKRIVARKMESARKKANAISEQPEIADRSKRRMIEQVYKKAATRRPKKEFVVAKKGVAVKGGKGKVVVDRRMKKDARVKGSKGSKGKGSKGSKGKGSKSKQIKRRGNPKP